MNNSRASLLTTIAVCMMALPSFAHADPSSNQRLGSGPSIDETSNYISNQIKIQGIIQSFAQFSYSGGDGAGVLNYRYKEDYNPTPNGCKFNLYNRENNQYINIDFSQLQRVDIISGQELAYNSVAKDNHNVMIKPLSPLTPALFIVRANFVSNMLSAQGASQSSLDIAFQDHDTALRVSKAIVHANDLCGGRKDQPF
ncbi:hypothetical protein [Novosphingobium terrae]|uniref:hypothetical protein n=1 Tax=Novosphingobium terrae TaxID=2726189 RepID=UPI00198020C6|nr:hypothetical protein [Novosphingobium terrae]